MTWKLKVLRVVCGLAVVAGLAMASGLDWTEFLSDLGLA